MTGLDQFSLSSEIIMRNPGPIMQVIVSVTLMGAALYVMVWQTHDTDSQRWASGILGAIMTFWLTGGQKRR
jgi:hypothetical protein